LETCVEPGWTLYSGGKREERFGMEASASQQTIVEARELTKIFRDFWHRPRVKAVNGLSFEIQPGEVFGLLGPNGSGKTTTLKMILGLLHPTRGHLRVLGHSPRNVKAKSRVGYLPEESYLYPYLTSEETLDFYGRLFDLDRRERKQRIEQLLDMIGLKHARNRVVGEFSKGMARRIGLAQALINDPDLVILDEPTAGLDPIGCRQVKDLILTLADRGKTVLLSSHLLADVEDVCDRVAILYNGRFQAVGSINDLLAEKTRFTLNMPEVEPEVLKRVLSAVREVLGAEPDVGHPRRDLEAFFLEVVEQARRDAREDARSGRVLAQYLSQRESGAKSGLLEQLAKPEPEKDAEKEEQVSDQEPEEPAPETAAPAPSTDADRKLSSLVRPSDDHE
jgi:ABC-2 type transport system ATP-binding protein